MTIKEKQKILDKRKKDLIENLNIDHNNMTTQVFEQIHAYDKFEKLFKKT